MSKNERSIKNFFATRKVTKDNIVACIKLLYEYQIYKRQTILSSNFLQKIINEVLKVTKPSVHVKNLVNNNLFDIFMTYRLKSNASVAHAPAVNPVKLRNAIRNLFYNYKLPHCDASFAN